MVERKCENCVHYVEVTVSIANADRISLGLAQSDGAQAVIPVCRCDADLYFTADECPDFQPKESEESEEEDKRT